MTQTWCVSDGDGPKFNHSKNRRFESMFPFTRVPFWVPIFDPQPFQRLPFDSFWGASNSQVLRPPNTGGGVSNGGVGSFIKKPITYVVVFLMEDPTPPLDTPPPEAFGP